MTEIAPPPVVAPCPFLVFTGRDGSEIHVRPEAVTKFVSRETGTTLTADGATYAVRETGEEIRAMFSPPRYGPSPLRAIYPSAAQSRNLAADIREEIPRLPPAGPRAERGPSCDADEWITVKEAAARLGITPWAVHKRMRAGTIQHRTGKVNGQDCFLVSTRSIEAVRSAREASALKIHAPVPAEPATDLGVEPITDLGDDWPRVQLSLTLEEGGEPVPPKLVELSFQTVETRSEPRRSHEERIARVWPWDLPFPPRIAREVLIAVINRIPKVATMDRLRLSDEEYRRAYSLVGHSARDIRKLPSDQKSKAILDLCRHWRRRVQAADAARKVTA